MNSSMITYILIGSGVLFGIILIAFIILQKNNKEAKYIRQLQQGTKTTSFWGEVLY